MSSLVAGVGCCVIAAGLLGVAMGYGFVALIVVGVGAFMVVQAIRG